MITFIEKLRELIESAEQSTELRDAVLSQSETYLQQFAAWPVNTEVPLSRLAYVVAGLLLEPNANVRRLRATDTLNMKDGLG